MNEEWRNFLYPFGLLAQGAFGLRFLAQWLAAEKEKKSITPPLFWKLSLFGNILLLANSLIQLHVPMSLVQSQNAIMSWRNLNLLGPESRRLQFSSVLLVLSVAALCVIIFFALQTTDIYWLSSPGTTNPAWGLHLLGIWAIICFNLRFWVQWWQAECNLEGQLTESFWWISLFGAIVSASYFFIVQDWVYCIGPTLGLIPYSRNLIFIRRARGHAPN